MEAREVSLHEQLPIPPPAIISITGGGGKTSLLFALAKALTDSGQRVLCATTTKMFRPEAEDWLAVAVEEEPARLRLPARGALFAARPPDAETGPDKVRGYNPEAVDDLFRRGVADWILVEADGAAGRPLKAPAAHEPVIPSLSGAAVAVMGLECVGRPLSKATAFRLPQIFAVTGLSEGDVVSPRAIARLADHPQGMFKNAPASAARLLFCNKADDSEAETIGLDVADAIRKRRPGFLREIYIGSLRTKGLRCLSLPAV